MVKNIEAYSLFNATLEGENIRIHSEMSIDLAMALNESPIVLVIRQTNRKTLQKPG